MSIEAFFSKKELTAKHPDRFTILRDDWGFHLTVCPSSAFCGEEGVDSSTTGGYYHTIDILRLWGLWPFLPFIGSVVICQQEAFYKDTEGRRG